MIPGGIREMLWGQIPFFTFARNLAMARENRYFIM